MSDRRLNWEGDEGTCCIEYCHVCQRSGANLQECPHCRFLFCNDHMPHDCIRKPAKVFRDDVCPECLCYKTEHAPTCIVLQYDKPVEVGVFRPIPL